MDERRLDRAVPAQPLDDLDDVAPRHEPLGLVVAQRVELLAVVPGDRVRVAQALGHDQQQTRALALQERVQADGRPVHEEVDGTGLGHELTQALEHALARGRRVSSSTLPETVSARPSSTTTKSVNVPPMSIATR